MKIKEKRQVEALKFSKVDTLIQFDTIISSSRNSSSSTVTLDEAEDQVELLIKIMNFKEITRAKNPRKKNKRKIFLKAYMHFLMVEKRILIVLKVEYF